MYRDTTKTFGVMVERLSIDQPSYTIIEQLNKISKKYSPIVFFLDYSNTLQTPLFAKMPMEQSIYFRNPVIATCLETAQILMNSVGPTKRFLYLWNLDWLYYNDAEKKYREIYAASSLNFIVRSLEHAKVLHKCWLTKPERISIVEDFNCDKITRLF